MKKANTDAPRTLGNSRIVAKNIGWMGVDSIFGLVLTISTSILIARVIGHDAMGRARLGTYSYIVLLTTITLTMGSFGLPATARKYMAEYLNNGKPEVARATYLSTLKIQIIISLAAAGIAILAVSWLADPHYFAASVLLVIAIVPRLIATIPSQANNAAEDMRRNTLASVIGVSVSTACIVLTLIFGWEFVGLSAAVLLSASVECVIKLIGVEQWLGRVPRGAVAPELRNRMLTFSALEMGLLLLNLLVWDRSDLLVLKKMNPDPTQIIFFSIPFSLAERALIFPSMFAASLGFTLMAQYGRGESRLREMTVEGGRYALLVALPLLVGMACVSKPLVLLVYSKGYAPMIPTLTIIALFALPKALVAAPTFLLQTIERQGFLVAWGCLCGGVDIALDFLLVGRYGANGAAIANGTAQAMAAVGIWIYAWRTYDLKLRLGDCGRIVASGAIMAVGVLGIVRAIPGVAGLVIAVVAGAALWMIGLRLTSALKREDVGRFRSIGTQLPAAFRPLWGNLIGWLAPSISID